MGSAATRGDDGGDWLEVTHGLRGDESVVIGGVDLVADGIAVAVARKSPPAPRVATEPVKTKVD